MDLSKDNLECQIWYSLVPILAMPLVNQIDVCYTDFNQAFDRLKFPVVLKPLTSYGVSGSVLGWFESYLSNHVKYVTIRQSKSVNILVPSGVLEGSHVGSTLLVLMMNFVVFALDNVFFVMYADDLKIFRSIRSEGGFTVSPRQYLFMVLANGTRLESQ